jgi:hypothetical protein
MQDAESLYLLDEIGGFAMGGANGREFDIHISLARRRMVQVKHALALTGKQTLPQRAGLAGAIAGYVVTMGNRMAGLADDRMPAAIVAPVGLVRRKDAEIPITEDMRLWEGIEIGNQFSQRMHGPNAASPTLRPPTVDGTPAVAVGCQGVPR